MPRLNYLKPSIGRLQPRLVSPDSHEARDRINAWRAWYRSPAWQMLRKRVFARDGYVCRKTGVLLIGRHPAPNSPVADHIVPHRGDAKLFWDIDNIQTVSKAYHDAEKQRRERSTGGGGQNV